MLKEMLKVLARYEDRAEVFGGDVEWELESKGQSEKSRILIRELYDLRLITYDDEQESNGLVTVHSTKARRVLTALGIGHRTQVFSNSDVRRVSRPANDPRFALRHTG